MATKSNRLVPARAIHPGEILREELQERGIKQKDFARTIGIQATHLNEFIKGKRNLNEDLAIKLESQLGIPFKTWMNLQNGYTYERKFLDKKKTKEQDARQFEQTGAGMTHSLFKTGKAVNALLYSLQKLGGRSDMHKLCKILYFADQKHLSQYGRSITGDTYIAMQYGPVPSNVDDILKALRGDSFFSGSEAIVPLKESMTFENRYIIRAMKKPDMAELSSSDAKCLDDAIAKCKDKSFDELTQLSHGLAWSNTRQDRAISVKDILREAGDEEAYVEYIDEKLKLQAAFL